MGGSIRKGYGDLGYAPDHGPQPEYNIYSDVAAAQKLFASGVPIFMMPLDSTELMLDEVKRNILFSAGTVMTNSLASLYYQWVERNRTPTATLFDVMAVAYVVQPELCPVTEFHITVDAQGFTRPGAGAANASACLASDSEKFFHFVLPRLIESPRVTVNLRMSVTGKDPAFQTKAPAPQPIAPLSHPDNDYWQKHDAQLLVDFPWLARFKEADLKLGPPAPGENRVVFMGDSITEGWHFDGPSPAFAGKPYINRGISGQTTPQMVLRFHQDVIALQPKLVVILAGTNDIAGNTGPMTPEQTEDNLAAMAEMATANHIRVVLCSVLPALDYQWQPGLTPAPKIDAINAWIKVYAEKHGHIYVDYHSAMKDERDGLPANLSRDGVHPTPAGYAVMMPLVEAGIAKALAP
jgi:lysophospholipase L1-like esterase